MILQILVNGAVMQIGQPLPTSVSSIEVIHQVHPMMPPQLVTIEQAVSIKEWIKNLIALCESEYISYNGTFISTAELKANNK